MHWRHQQQQTAATAAELAERFGSSRSTVTKMLAITGLPESVTEIIRTTPFAFGLNIGYSLALYFKQFGELQTIELAQEIATEKLPYATVEAIRKAEASAEQTCFLYLLLHVNERAFKVGVASNVHARILDIGHPISASESYVLHGTRAECFRAEGVIHKLLWRYRLAAEDLSGGSEWFDAVCKPRALEILNFLAADFDLSKPMPLPFQPPRIYKLRGCNGFATVTEWDDRRLTIDVTIRDAARRETYIANIKQQFDIKDKE